MAIPCPSKVDLIERTECIGNSLSKINNNFKNLDDAGCDLQSEIGSLLTLINQLSSNMQNLGNYPYTRLTETINDWSDPNAGVYGPPPANANSYTIYDRPLNVKEFVSDSTKMDPILVSNGFQLPIGTYRFAWKTSGVAGSAFSQLNAAEWLLVDNASPDNPIIRSNMVVLHQAAYADEGEISNILEGTFKVTNPSTIYKMRMRIGYTFYTIGGSTSIVAAIKAAYGGALNPKVANSAVLSEMQLWKIG